MEAPARAKRRSLVSITPLVDSQAEDDRRMSVPAFNSRALIVEGDNPATRAQRRTAKKIPNFLRVFTKNLAGNHRACRGPAWGTVAPPRSRGPRLLLAQTADLVTSSALSCSGAAGEQAGENTAAFPPQQAMA